MRAGQTTVSTIPTDQSFSGRVLRLLHPPGTPIAASIRVLLRRHSKRFAFRPRFPVEIVSGSVVRLLSGDRDSVLVSFTVSCLSVHLSV